MCRPTWLPSTPPTSRRCCSRASRSRFASRVAACVRLSAAMPVAALQTWCRVQASVWLPVLVVLGVCGAAGPYPSWPQALLAGIAVSFASLAWILRGWSLADLVTMARVAGLLIVIGAGAGQIGFLVWAAAVAV